MWGGILLPLNKLSEELRLDGEGSRSRTGLGGWDGYVRRRGEPRYSWRGGEERVDIVSCMTDQSRYVFTNIYT